MVDAIQREKSLKEDSQDQIEHSKPLKDLIEKVSTFIKQLKKENSVSKFVQARGHKTKFEEFHKQISALSQNFTIQLELDGAVERRAILQDLAELKGQAIGLLKQQGTDQETASNKALAVQALELSKETVAELSAKQNSLSTEVDKLSQVISD